MKFIIGNKYTARICILLLICWMGVIFYLSCENADDSTDTSGFLVNTLARLLGIELYTDSYFALTTFIRKCAHFFEFAVLGGLGFTVLSHYNIKPILRALCAFGFTAIYAATDELHQYFVPGRACRFTDVCIDSSGGALGILFAFFMIYLFYNKEKIQ